MSDYIDEIDVLMPSDIGRFTKLPALEPLFGVAMIESTSEDAALISYGKIITKWFPKSQLCSDFDGNLYLANWLYEKEIEE